MPDIFLNAGNIVMNKIDNEHKYIRQFWKIGNSGRHAHVHTHTHTHATPQNLRIEWGYYFS